MNPQDPDPATLFTDNDLDFLLEALSATHSTKTAIKKLLKKPKARHELLSSNPVFEALKVMGPHRDISSYLYYATIVSKTLESSGIHEPLMAESLSMSINKVANNLKQQDEKLKTHDSHISLMLIVGIKDQKDRKQFQIIGDLEKACVVIEGTLSEQKQSNKSNFNPPPFEGC